MTVRSIRLASLSLALALALAACGGGSSDSSSDAQGGTSSDAAGSSVAASASPSVDPMTVARMQGMYDVVKRVVASKNFSDIKAGQSFKRTYDVQPECPTGPCGGILVIDAEESKQDITQALTYDETTHTYGIDAKISPAVCTGADGKKYKLKTTNTFELTPTKVELQGEEYIVVKFTAVGELKSVAAGAAVSQGKCKTASAKYSYSGQSA